MTTPPPRPPLWAGLVRSPAHGPLPVLLLVLTAATGVIDAVSILALGRVFVANMTGNVVFVGMALAGAPGFSLSASLAALAGFLLGALAGGRVLRRRDTHRGRLLRDGPPASRAWSHGCGRRPVRAARDRWKGTYAWAAEGQPNPTPGGRLGVA